jgi:hypothetical protein
MKKIIFASIFALITLCMGCAEYRVERQTKRLTQLILGDWNIQQVTNYVAPNNVLYDVGTINFSYPCADGTGEDIDECSHYAYYKEAGKPDQYEMHWTAWEHQNGKKMNFYANEVTNKNTLIGNNDTTWEITEATKYRLVIRCVYQEIIFSR